MPSLGIRQFQGMFHRVKKILNITQRGVDLKTFRKTFGTRLASSGMERTRAADLLGHDDVQTTKKYYADIHTDNLREEVDSIFAKAKIADRLKKKPCKIYQGFLYIHQVPPGGFPRYPRFQSPDWKCKSRVMRRTRSMCAPNQEIGSKGNSHFAFFVKTLCLRTEVLQHTGVPFVFKKQLINYHL
jgi:hypothetical protein